MCTYKQFFDFLWNFTIFDQKKCARATRQVILLIGKYVQNSLNFLKVHR